MTSGIANSWAMNIVGVVLTYGSMMQGPMAHSVSRLMTLRRIHANDSTTTPFNPVCQWFWSAQ